MNTTAQKEFLFRVPKNLYNKDLQKMMDYLRFNKATQRSKATQKGVEKIVEEVRKSRNEKKLASRYL
jgi:hypothetical protein